MKYRLRVLKAWGPAILSALLLIFSLSLLWAVTDFPLPREQTLRRLEDQALLPHGTTLASGSTEMEPFAQKTPRFTWTLRGDGEQTWVLLMEVFGPLSRPYSGYAFRSPTVQTEPFWGNALEFQTFSTPTEHVHDGSLDFTWSTDFFLLAYAADPAVARVEALAGWQKGAGDSSALTAGTLTRAEGGEGVWTGHLIQSPQNGGVLAWRLRAYDEAGTLLYEDCSDPEYFASLFE